MCVRQALEDLHHISFVCLGSGLGRTSIKSAKQSRNFEVLAVALFKRAAWRVAARLVQSLSACVYWLEEGN